MKQISSSTTGLVEAMPKQIGKQHGETGYATPAPISQSTKPQWVAKVPPWLSETISEDLSSLVSSINQGIKTSDKVSARHCLAAALDRARRQQVSADPKIIVKVMVGLANLFRSEMPDDTVLQMYVSIFQEIPEYALRAAAVDVAKTHKYPSMPLPADLLQHANKHILAHNAWVYRMELALARVSYGMKGEAHE